MITVASMVQTSPPVLTVNDIALLFAGTCFWYFARRFSTTADMVLAHNQSIHGDTQGKRGIVGDVERLYEWRRADADTMQRLSLTLEQIAATLEKNERWMEEHDRREMEGERHRDSNPRGASDD